MLKTTKSPNMSNFKKNNSNNEIIRFGIIKSIDRLLN